MEGFTFIIVASKGEPEQVLKVACANAAAAIDAAQMFAEDAAHVALWRDGVLLWSSDLPGGRASDQIQFLN